MMPEMRRVQKCATCAFNPGTEANRSYTPIKAKLCAEIPEPFLCHEEAMEVCCAGWSDLTERLLREGYYERQSEFQRKVKVAIVQALSKVEQSGGSIGFIDAFKSELAEAS